MRYAVIDAQGDVINAIEAPENFTLPDVTLIASDLAGPGWRFENGEFVEPLPPNGTAEGVISERERRLGLGFDYDFNDARGVHRIGTTRKDMEGWNEVTSVSNAAISIGQPNSSIDIATDTGPCVITAIEWQNILIAVAQFRQPIWTASFTLMNMSPIPSDFKSEIYWSI
jgi:hypothetical protein